MHISELAQHHVENPREIIQPGDPVRVKILEIDSERRRLSLSIKRVEGQVLPVRPIVPPPEDQAGDLDDVPELGLSEDVFAGADEVAAPDAPSAVDERGARGATLASGSRGRRARGRCGGGRPGGSRGRGRSRPEDEAPAAAPEDEAPAADSRRRGRPGREPPRTQLRLRPVSRPRTSRPERPDLPFIGLTGRDRRREVEALAALERLGAATLSTDAVVHELYEVAGGGRRGARSASATMSPPAGSSTAPPWPGWRSPRRRTGRGWRGCCGRASARGWSPGARGSPSATRARGRPSSRCRCCSSPGWSGRSTRRSRSSPRRRCGPSGPAPAATRRSTSARARQLSQDEKAQRATYAVDNDGTVGELEAKLSSVLGKLSG